MITRDELAVDLETMLKDCKGGERDPSFNPIVLGIREAKGLEFNDIVIVNFFSSTDVGKGWANLMALKWQNQYEEGGSTNEEGGNKNALIQAAKERGLPEDLEVDLKMLYTAITRCRSRLVIAETRPTNQFKKIVQRFRDADKQVSGFVPSETEKTRMPDEWRATGMQFLRRAVDLGIDEDDGVDQSAAKFLNIAKDSFKSGGKECSDLYERTQTMVDNLYLKERIDAVAPDRWEERERMAADAVVQMVHVGLLNQATDIIERACQQSMDTKVVLPLYKRVQKCKAKFRPSTGGGGGGGSGGLGAAEDG